MTIVIFPTYLILNQFMGVVDVQTVKSGGSVDDNATYRDALKIGPAVILVQLYRPIIPACKGDGYGGAGTKSFNAIFEDNVKIGIVSLP